MTVGLSKCEPSWKTSNLPLSNNLEKSNYIFTIPPSHNGWELKIQLTLKEISSLTQGTKSTLGWKMPTSTCSAWLKLSRLTEDRSTLRQEELDTSPLQLRLSSHHRQRRYLVVLKMTSPKPRTLPIKAMRWTATDSFPGLGADWKSSLSTSKSHCRRERPST